MIEARASSYDPPPPCMSESDVVIRVEGLGKKYALHHEKAERHTALRDVVARQARAAGLLLNPFTLAGQLRKAQREAAESGEEEFWALKDVSFEIRRGERVGIIGRNGAGKSTLLKILSRITEPTTGRVEIRGRVASLLEVGTGFHPELTGRENIYLNGAILGMTRREIRSKFDEIVDFAEVEKFLDTPVKRYSSGMYVRLAFAVAAHLEPEILVVDEVLAVGDASFQKKCLGKMEDVSLGSERTVLFVSHNMEAISRLCPRTVYFQQGGISFDGDTAQSVKSYFQVDSAKGFYTGANDNQCDAYVKQASMKVDGVISATYLNQGAFALEVDIGVNRDCECCIELILRGESGSPIMFWPSGFLGHSIWRLKCNQIRHAVVNLKFPELARGGYSFDIILADPGKRFIQYLESCLEFEVVGSGIPLGKWEFKQARNQGSMIMDACFGSGNSDMSDR